MSSWDRNNKPCGSEAGRGNQSSHFLNDMEQREWGFEGWDMKKEILTTFYIIWNQKKNLQKKMNF